MGGSLVELSGEMAAAVESAAPGVVRVEGRRRSASSGVVWSADGVIVASHHAVDAEEGVPVGLHDGRTVPAHVVGRDPGSDLAVLRAEATGLAVPRWDERAAPRVGHLVIGLSRHGRSARARLGIVGAVAGEWRTPAGGRLESYLETDIEPHPGFSGGCCSAPTARPSAPRPPASCATPAWPSRRPRCAAWSASFSGAGGCGAAG